MMHVSPGTAYTRLLDGAITIMVERQRGWFVYRDHSSVKPHIANDNVAAEKPCLTELERLERSTVESPEDISNNYVTQELDRLFRSEKELVEVCKGGARFINGKRRVRTNTLTCSVAPSKSPWRNFAISRPTDNKLFLDMAAHAVGFRHCTLTRALARILTSRLDNQVPAGLGDNVEQALRNRVAIERFNVDYPQKDYPDSKIIPRDPRNSSPSRKKDPVLLSAFFEYFELNKSFEPLQSNWMQADNENYYAVGSEEGDVQKPERSDEAEWEMRPELTELVDCYSAPTVTYETRQVGLLTGPKLSDCGYCMAPTSPLVRTMKLPISGDVECIGFHKGRLLECEDAARVSLAGLGIRRTRKQIDIYVDRLLKPERLNITDVARWKPWTVCRIGDLRFAPSGTKNFSLGEVVKYGSNGGMYKVKDEYGTPYGPESSGSVEAKSDDDKERDNKGWKPVDPRTRKTKLVWLSPAEKAKQPGNRKNPIACPMTADEALKSFHIMLAANGKPANDNGDHDGLPYDVESRDELQFGYAFGRSYADSGGSEPFDDVAERKELLAAVNAGLSSQARRVANMVVLTDETDTLAQNMVEVGAALATGRRNASERTLMRRGQKAIDDAAAELNKVRQELAA
jgi:hypothetical protein